MPPASEEKGDKSLLQLFRAMKKSYDYFAFFLLSIIIFYSMPVVLSQNSGCYFTAMNLYGPPSLQEGQILQVHVLFSVTCPAGGVYVIRSDLVDGRTERLLSTVRALYAIVGPFAGVLTNNVTVPKVSGWWPLQINLYLLDLNGIPAAPQSQQLFGLNVTGNI